MHNKSIRRRRVILVLLVLASIALLTTYFRESTLGGLHALQRGVMEAVAPLQKGASTALKPARDLIGWTGDVFDAKSENKRLKRQVEQLQSEVASLSTAARDNRELRGLVHLRDSGILPDSYSPLSARVIARSPTVWYSTITVDKGSKDGVRQDQPVVSGQGLVGKVTGVSDSTAQITLITDHTSAVSVQVVPDGPVGLMRPEVGNPNNLVIDYIESKKPLRYGAMVITAGWSSGSLESLFPRGLPIGRITQSGEGEVKLYQRAHLRPFADLRYTDIVEILRKQ